MPSLDPSWPWKQQLIQKSHHKVYYSNSCSGAFSQYHTKNELCSLKNGNFRCFFQGQEWNFTLNFNQFHISLSIQPLCVTLRVVRVAGMSSPLAMALTGSGAHLWRFHQTTAASHHLWTTLQTALKVEKQKHMYCTVVMPLCCVQFPLWVFTREIEMWWSDKMISLC